MLSAVLAEQVPLCVSAGKLLHPDAVTVRSCLVFQFQEQIFLIFFFCWSSILAASAFCSCIIYSHSSTLEDFSWYWFFNITSSCFKLEIIVHYTRCPDSVIYHLRNINYSFISRFQMLNMLLLVICILFSVNRNIWKDLLNLYVKEISHL